jgi:hypothetical protein
MREAVHADLERAIFALDQTVRDARSDPLQEARQAGNGVDDADRAHDRRRVMIAAIRGTGASGAYLAALPARRIVAKHG